MKFQIAVVFLTASFALPVIAQVPESAPRLKFSHEFHTDRDDLRNYPGSFDENKSCLNCHETGAGHYLMPKAESCIQCHDSSLTQLEGVKTHLRLSDKFQMQKDEMPKSHWVHRVSPIFRKPNPKNAHQRSKEMAMDCRDCHLDLRTQKIVYPTPEVCNRCHCDNDVMDPPMLEEKPGRLEPRH